MVGALLSNRCETCRIRKVKCDLGWPVCGQCKRSNRTCPPRSALKIMDESAQFQIQAEKRAAAANTPHQRPKQPKRNKAQGKKLTPAKDFSPVPSTGGMKQTIPLSATERLSLGMINVICIETPSFSLRIIGQFIQQIPRLLGVSNALDSVVACLLASHDHLLRGGDPACRINEQLYSRALHQLQIALNDSDEWCSLSTVYATLFMHRIEAVFGHFPNRAIAVHESGLTALLQKKGPPDVNDPMELQVIMDCHLSIIQNAVSRKEYCFLASSEWVNALDRHIEALDSSNLKTVYFRLIRLMTCCPTLVCEYAPLWNGQTLCDGEINRLTLYTSACTVLEALIYINHDLDKIIHDQKLIITVPSSRPDDLPLMFQVHDTMAALAICHCAMITIVVLRIMLWLLQTQSQMLQSIIPCKKTFKRTAELQTEVMNQCHRVWMLIEHSRCTKPLGLPVMQAALVFTFEATAEDTSMRQNVLNALNEVSNGEWSEQRVEHVARSMRGECSMFLS